jgi:hypothetical protein
MGLRINVALYYGDGDQNVVLLQANSRRMGRGSVRNLQRSLVPLTGQPTAQLRMILAETEVSPSSVGYVPLFMLGEPHPDPDFIIEIKPSGVALNEVGQEVTWLGL